MQEERVMGKGEGASNQTMGLPYGLYQAYLWSECLNKGHRLGSCITSVPYA